jgi:hypothetical protein
VTIDTVHRIASVHAGLFVRKWPASEKVMSSAMMNQL